MSQYIYVCCVLGANQEHSAVIAADGINTQPQTVKSAEMLAGQRYDVVVRAL